MPPAVVLIRHAQALHNIDNKSPNHQIPDPVLSDLGIQQCRDLRENLLARFGDERDVGIVVSPMRRTMQTALLSLDWLIEKGVQVQADALWQENSAKPCDTGSAVEDLAVEFPSVDFSHLDPVYPDKTTPRGAKYAYTRDAILARARSCLETLRKRPEKLIIVVSHSAFLRLGLTGYWFFNGDYRIFDFEQDIATPVIKQRDSTISGGLGLSWADPVELGSMLPD